MVNIRVKTFGNRDVLIAELGESENRLYLCLISHLLLKQLRFIFT